MRWAPCLRLLLGNLLGAAALQEVSRPLRDRLEQVLDAPHTVHEPAPLLPERPLAAATADDAATAPAAGGLALAGAASAAAHSAEDAEGGVARAAAPSGEGHRALGLVQLRPAEDKSSRGAHKPRARGSSGRSLAKEGSKQGRHALEAAGLHKPAAKARAKARAKAPARAPAKAKAKPKAPAAAKHQARAKAKPKARPKPAAAARPAALAAGHRQAASPKHAATNRRAVEPAPPDPPPPAHDTGEEQPDQQEQPEAQLDTPEQPEASEAQERPEAADEAGDQQGDAGGVEGGAEQPNAGGPHQAMDEAGDQQGDSGGADVAAEQLDSGGLDQATDEAGDQQGDSGGAEVAAEQLDAGVLDQASDEAGHHQGDSGKVEVGAEQPDAGGPDQAADEAGDQQGDSGKVEGGSEQPDAAGPDQAADEAGDQQGDSGKVEGGSEQPDAAGPDQAPLPNQAAAQPEQPAQPEEAAPPEQAEQLAEPQEAAQLEQASPAEAPEQPSGTEAARVERPGEESEQEAAAGQVQLARAGGAAGLRLSSENDLRVALEGPPGPADGAADGVDEAEEQPRVVAGARRLAGRRVSTEWVPGWVKAKEALSRSQRIGGDEPGLGTRALQSRLHGAPWSPEKPGCYVWAPTGCPNHLSFVASTWQHDSYGEEYGGAGKNQTVCEDMRGPHFRHWCGAEDVQMLWVSGNVDVAGAATQLLSEKDADAPQAPGCYVRLSTGCPRHPTFQAPSWTLDPYWARHKDVGPATEEGCQDRSARFAHWCGASEAQVTMLFVEGSPSLGLGGRYDRLAATGSVRHVSAVPAAPTDPGCYSLVPFGCPRHPLRTSASWTQETWEGANASKEACDARERPIAEWCNTTEVKMLYVRSKTQRESLDNRVEETRAEVALSPPTAAGAAAPAHVEAAESAGRPQAPSDAGCYVFTPLGCPRHSTFEKASMKRWVRDVYGEKHLGAGSNGSVCEGRGMGHYADWCGTAKVEMAFISGTGSSDGAASQPQAPQAAAVPEALAQEPAAVGPREGSMLWETPPKRLRRREEPSPSPDPVRSASADEEALEMASMIDTPAAEEPLPAPDPVRSASAEEEALEVASLIDPPAAEASSATTASSAAAAAQQRPAAVTAAQGSAANGPRALVADTAASQARLPRLTADGGEDGEPMPRRRMRRKEDPVETYDERMLREAEEAEDALTASEAEQPPPRIQRPPKPAGATGPAAVAEAPLTPKPPQRTPPALTAGEAAQPSTAAEGAAEGATGGAAGGAAVTLPAASEEAAAGEVQRPPDNEEQAVDDGTRALWDMKNAELIQKEVKEAYKHIRASRSHEGGVELHWAWDPELSLMLISLIIWVLGCICASEIKRLWQQKPAPEL